MKKNPARPSLRLCLTVLFMLAPGIHRAVAETDDDLGELLYSENFNSSTNINGWFAFGGGEGMTFRGDVIPFAGKDGTNAYVFSANAENDRNYWFGGIGRGEIIRKPWTSLDNLTLQLDMGSIGDDKTHRVSLRLVQGDPNKPTWSDKWALEVSRTIQTYTLCLSAGERTGKFDREVPITLHAITFGHTHFGPAPDVQIVVDNVKTFGRDRLPPPR